jgi:hypothetical protein
MQNLDPAWLSVELAAIQKEQQNWDSSLRSSYDASMQRVFAYQEQISAETQETQRTARRPVR